MSVQKFKMRRFCEGVYEFVPVVFDEQHFCVALTTVHSCLLDYRFRSKAPASFNRLEALKKIQEDAAESSEEVK